MASLSFMQFASLPRWHSNWPFFTSFNPVRVQHLRLKDGCVLTAISKKKADDSSPSAQVVSDGEMGAAQNSSSGTSTRPKRAPSRRRKKDEDADVSITDEETVVTSVSIDDSKKKPVRRTRKKATSASATTLEEEEETEKKVTRRRRTNKKKADDSEVQGGEAEASDGEGGSFVPTMEDVDEEELDIGRDGEEDISYTYGWPPLVCCFGSAQYAFVPSARPANRLIDHEMHERRRDALWIPEKFVRAPGGCSSNVALALANLGGKVALMGKLGGDDYGQALLYYLNTYKVQTRSIRIDSKRVTAVSHMKIVKRGGLRMSCLKPCAEDSLSRAEINLDVLKEAKMFYFNTFALLDRNMRSTAMRAIKISKKLGGVIFYDLNLPLPLWQSAEETKTFIQQAWNLADIIELTKQELEFLCGIKPTENFDTKDNHISKFVHYEPEVLAPIWHENLKVLFVTNGTSKIHYYTKDHNGAVLGMEDPPLTPYTGDMSASGDGIVAGLMRLLTEQPHLMTDKKYLEHCIKYAINCGVLEQWGQVRKLGYPPKEGMEEEEAPPDSNGIRSITEKQYRTLVPVSLQS